MIEARVVEVAFSSIFTRTLFVRVAPNPPLQQLRQSLGENDREPFDPHLSLLYQKLSPLRRAELAKEIQLPFASVTFDSVSATRCRIPVESVADVGYWEMIAIRPLL
ncbi:MAG: 2'-5' RNA ligase family protein [Chthoniobacterales bacterium]